MFGTRQGQTRYTTQSLTRPTNGRLDRWRQQLEHRMANRYFESQRRLYPRSLEEVFPGLAHARCIVQNAVPTPNALGNADPGEIIILSTLCMHLKPRVIVEFGTFDGLTALHMAINSPQDTQVITVDLHPDDPIRKQNSDDTFYSKGVVLGEHFLNTPEAAKIRQVYSDTTTFDHSALRGKVNLMFIDAGHAYELVKSDSLKALDMAAPGGVIPWHDYHYAHEGVYRWLNELAGQVELFQVPATKLVCHVKPR